MGRGLSPDSLCAVFLPVLTIIACSTGQTIPKGVCDHIAVKLESNIAARLESEKEEKSGNSSMGPIVVWQGIVAFLAILLLVTLFLTFRRRNPPKQEYNTCVAPVLKEKIGDSV